MPGIMQKEVLFNNGEAVEHGDFNSLQRFAGALLLDGIVGRLMRDHDLTSTLTTTFAWVFGNDAAPYAPGAGTRVSAHLEGTIYQRVSGTTPDGNDAKVLAYYCGANEYAVTHDAAAASPRWDLISVQLAQVSNDAADGETRDFEDASTLAPSSPTVIKRRKVAATFTVTKGTEAATPAMPATPAGHVRVAAYKVTPGMTTFSALDIRDFRMPFGAGFAEVVAHAALANPTDWTLTSFKLSTAGANSAVFVCPNPGGSRRLTRVHSTGYWVSGAAPLAVINRWSLGSGSGAIVKDISGTLLTGTDASTPEFRTYNLLADMPDEPVWTNGRSAGYAIDRSVADGRCNVSDDPLRPSAVALAFVAVDNLHLVAVRFQFCGGL